MSPVLPVFTFQSSELKLKHNTLLTPGRWLLADFPIVFLGEICSAAAALKPGTLITKCDALFVVCR